MKTECGADNFYNNVINEFAKIKMKKWIDLLINFNNSLFVDFINFSHNH